MFNPVYSWNITMRFRVRYIIMAETFRINFIQRFKWVWSAYSILFTNVMPNKFSNRVEFMIEQIFRNSYMKYFFARTVSKLAQFTPFSSINIPSKWELLIISAKFLPPYCASMYKSSLMLPPRRQTKERHKLQLMDVKTPRATHPTRTLTGEGESSNEGEDGQGQRNYKSRKEPDEQTPRITR